ICSGLDSFSGCLYCPEIILNQRPVRPRNLPSFQHIFRDGPEIGFAVGILHIGRLLAARLGFFQFLIALSLDLFTLELNSQRRWRSEARRIGNELARGLETERLVSGRSIPCSFPVGWKRGPAYPLLVTAHQPFFCSLPLAHRVDQVLEVLPCFFTQLRR